MKFTNIAKFTCSVYKNISPKIVEALKECGIDEYIFQRSSSIVSTDKHWLFNRKGISENILETYHFYVPAAKEKEVFDKIVYGADLSQEGRGSIFTEPAVLIEKSENNENFDGFDFAFENLQANYMGICAITQRGRGLTLAKTAIDKGSSVPMISYGIGGGIRDRMGLIRITIPAEKETINIVVANHDTEGMMDLLIEGGHLDRPGMGFIFSYPVSMAVLDTKTFFGANRAAASMGQIISVIDSIQGSTEWRKRTLNAKNAVERTYFTNLENIMLICNDTQSKEMLDAAMSAGASGATISNCREMTKTKDGFAKKSMEISDMVIGTAQRAKILTALVKAGFFSDKTSGKIIVKKSETAFSYTDKKKK